MKKSEMNTKQVESYYSIKHILLKYEFEFKKDEIWFENDIAVEPEIEASYNNGHMEISLDYTIAEDLLTLRLHDIISLQEIIFDLFPENTIGKVLDYISSIKNDVNVSNFAVFINDLLRICPKVFTYKNGKAFQLKPSD